MQAPSDCSLIALLILPGHLEFGWDSGSLHLNTENKAGAACLQQAGVVVAHAVLRLRRQAKGLKARQRLGGLPLHRRALPQVRPCLRIRRLELQLRLVVAVVGLHSLGKSRKQETEGR